MSLLVFDVPSKCRFDLIRITLEHILGGKSQGQLAQAIRQHNRHAHFLVQNAYILGFAERSGSDWTLTSNGMDFLKVSNERRGLMLAQAILDSKVVSLVLQRSGSIENAARMTTKQISDILMDTTLVSETSDDRIQIITAKRRASSVKGWIRWLDENLPMIVGDYEDELALAEQEMLEFYE